MKQKILIEKGFFMSATILCSLSDLIKAASKEIRNASRSHDQEAYFGASVLTLKGNIYSSGQYVSDTLSSTWHAAQAALKQATAHGENGIVALVYVGNENAFRTNDGIIYPCHTCIKLLWESHSHSGINTEIFIVDSCENLIEQISLIEIMKRL
jgi:cytidine deaminase